MRVGITFAAWMDNVCQKVNRGNCEEEFLDILSSTAERGPERIIRQRLTRNLRHPAQSKNSRFEGKAGTAGVIRQPLILWNDRRLAECEVERYWAFGWFALASLMICPHVSVICFACSTVMPCCVANCSSCSWVRGWTDIMFIMPPDIMPPWPIVPGPIISS